MMISIKKIAEKSGEYGLSQNRTVKLILKNSLLSDKKGLKKENFSDLFGKWTNADKLQFEENLKDFDVINESDWDK